MSSLRNEPLPQHCLDARPRGADETRTPGCPSPRSLTDCRPNRVDLTGTRCSTRCAKTQIPHHVCKHGAEPSHLPVIFAHSVHRTDEIRVAAHNREGHPLRRAHARALQQKGNAIPAPHRMLTAVSCLGIARALRRSRQSPRRTLSLTGTTFKRRPSASYSLRTSQSVRRSLPETATTDSSV